MTEGRRGRAVRRAALVVLGVLALLPAAAVSAHDPIILADAQTTPGLGPLLPDGTISFALYGVLNAPGDSRGFRVQFREGDRLELSLLVPAQQPEQSFTDDQLPTVVLTEPDGSVRLFAATGRDRFDESFSNTSYLRLLEVGEPAQAGVYGVLVDGSTPARFTVAVGSDERFGTPVENVVARDAGVQGVQRWYATPPPERVAAPDVGAAATSTSGPLEPVPTAPVPTEATTPTKSSGAAGTAVFFGAIAAIVVVGLVLYARRGRRFDAGG